MRTNLKTLFRTVAIVATLAGAPVLYANAEPQNQERLGGMMQGGQGGMMKNSQGGMMNMQQMSQMMESCNKMMDGMAQHHGREAPNGEKTPEKKG